jgi:hypothetical protein
MSLKEIDCRFSIENLESELIRRPRRLYEWTRIVILSGMAGRFESWHVIAWTGVPLIATRFRCKPPPFTAIIPLHMSIGSPMGGTAWGY